MADDNKGFQSWLRGLLRWLKPSSEEQTLRSKLGQDAEPREERTSDIFSPLLPPNSEER